MTKISKKEFRELTGEDPEDVLGGDWKATAEDFPENQDVQAPPSDSGREDLNILRHHKIARKIKIGDVFRNAGVKYMVVDMQPHAPNSFGFPVLIRDMATGIASEEQADILAFEYEKLDYQFRPEDPEWLREIYLNEIIIPGAKSGPLIERNKAIEICRKMQQEHLEQILNIRKHIEENGAILSKVRKTLSQFLPEKE